MPLVVLRIIYTVAVVASSFAGTRRLFRSVWRFRLSAGFEWWWLPSEHRIDFSGKTNFPGSAAWATSVLKNSRPIQWLFGRFESNAPTSTSARYSRTCGRKRISVASADVPQCTVYPPLHPARSMPKCRRNWCAADKAANSGSHLVLAAPPAYRWCISYDLIPQNNHFPLSFGGSSTPSIRLHLVLSSLFGALPWPLCPSTYPSHPLFVIYLCPFSILALNFLLVVLLQVLVFPISRSVT